MSIKFEFLNTQIYTDFLKVKLFTIYQLMLIKITFLLFFNRLQYVKHVNKALIN